MSGERVAGRGVSPCEDLARDVRLGVRPGQYAVSTSAAAARGRVQVYQCDELTWDVSLRDGQKPCT